MDLPNKRYKVILADPPWEYENKKCLGKFSKGHSLLDGGAENNYPTMPLEEICKMEVKQIAQRDSCLFLWATTPLLPEAFEVMKSWGYHYKTAIYWRKIMSLGMGWWFRGQVEVCLFGVRGQIKAFRSQEPNFIQSKVGKHSQKPDNLYGIIETLNLNPKIELFARSQREGWDAWGNQVPNHCQKLLTKEDA